MANDKLMVPALRAHMGNCIYYVALMTMRDIAELVCVTKEIDEDYIHRPQGLFNALVVEVHGGSPRWFELTLKKNRYMDPEDLPGYVDGTFGVLMLDGSEKLLVISGQHIVAGIRKAVEVNNEIGDDEVSVIFTAPYKSVND